MIYSLKLSTVKLLYAPKAGTDLSRQQAAVARLVLDLWCVSAPVLRPQFSHVLIRDDSSMLSTCPATVS